jgi:hypothetical protein
VNGTDLQRQSMKDLLWRKKMVKIRKCLMLWRAGILIKMMGRSQVKIITIMEEMQREHRESKLKKTHQARLMLVDKVILNF